MTDIRTPDDLLNAEKQQHEFDESCAMHLAMIRRQAEFADTEQAAQLVRDLTELLRDLKPILLLIALRDDLQKPESAATLEGVYSRALGDRFVSFADEVKTIRDELAAQLSGQ